MPKKTTEQYKEILHKYMDSQNEQDLYVGQKFSREFIEKEISPEDVIGIHKASLQEMLPDAPSALWHSFDFLIEVMIHYGLALQEHQSLIRKQEELDIEMKIAAQVQNTLLKTKVPHYLGLDVGYVSVPAKQMSGDYIYFMNKDEDHISVAIADVIGKGIPAALCMSIIKLGMDRLRHSHVNPGSVLEVINRQVEENIDDSMFISMFYGEYSEINSVFTYASAGHEPALHYCHKEKKFYELDADGLLLGVQNGVMYEERSVILKEGDFIVMMTDGVTETKTETGFISELVIQELLLEMKDDSAQQMVDVVYERLLEMQEFTLHDDFTIVILKKEVSS